MAFVDISDADFCAANENESFKIIYVDDVSSSLVALKRRLSNHHEVYCAENYDEMFNVLENVMPDIIFLDINMPGADGYEVIKSLKEDERYAKIPVVFFTGNRDRKSVLKGLSLGAADYIIKPFETPNLLECINKHVAAGRSEKINEADDKPRVLAVDDIASVLKSIQKVLCNDYIVHTISRPESVLDFLKLRKPDLIIMDYLMPVYNGFELIPMIRELSGYEDTPIIMLTSVGTLNNIKEAVALGACDFIVKPFRDNELIEKIAKNIKVNKK